MQAPRFVVPGPPTACQLHLEDTQAASYIIWFQPGSGDEGQSNSVILLAPHSNFPNIEKEPTAHCGT